MALADELKAPRVRPALKAEFTRSGATSYTYTRERMVEVEHEIQPFSQKARLVLNNFDRTLNDVDLKGYKCILSYGAATATDDVFGATPPLYVVAMRHSSSGGRLVVEVELAGIPNLLQEDRASGSYVPASDDTKTVKTLVGEILAATMTCYSHCTAYAVSWDSEDSLVDSYIPADGFRIYKNGSRLAAVRRLLDYTGCTMRVENDGKVHILVPTTSGTTYAAEYSLAAGAHPFFFKTYRNALVMPNKISVATPEDAETAYSGDATDSGSYAVLPVVQFETMNLASDAQGASIAAAILSKYQLHAQAGSAEIPLDVQLEVFDYVHVTDSRKADERTGNVGIVVHHYLAEQNTSRVVWTTRFTFGGWLNYRKLAQDIETHGVGPGDYSFNRLFVKDLYAENIQADNLDMVWIDPEGNIDLSKIGDTLDNLPDGETYARVKSMHLDAGQLVLDENVVYGTGYDPTGKMPGDADLDDIGEGTTYKRVKSTSVYAGNILLSSYTEVKTGTNSLWYDVGYVEIDADVGITLTGQDLVFQYPSTSQRHYIYPSSYELDIMSYSGCDIRFLNGPVQCSCDVLPKTHASYDLGTTSYRWDRVYCVDLYVTYAPWDAVDDLALVRAIRPDAKDTSRYDQATLPEMLKTSYRKAEKVAARTEQIDRDNDELRAILDGAIKSEARPEKRAELLETRAAVGSDRQARIDRYAESLDGEGSISLANSVGLLFGAVRQLADKHDELTGEIQALKAGGREA